MTLLTADNISLSFGATAVLHNASLGVKRGEMVGLIGPNGAGKTSLLRVLANLQEADSGTVCLNAQNIRQIPLKVLAKQIGYLAQGAPAHWPLLVEKVVELGRLPHQGFQQSWWQNLTEHDHQLIEKAIEQAEVGHLRKRVITTLSGGERMRVLLARLFASEPTLILADEPVAALDPYHQLHIMELLREHADEHGAVIVVLHDLTLAARFCDRLLLLKEGKVHAQGQAAEVLDKHHLETVYGIEARYLQDKGQLAVIPWQRKQP
jgi:iron complex transport system ATP-binding protein